MNMEKQDDDRNMTRRRVAAEVIELGEMLFDTAIDSAAQRATGGEESNPAFIEEMRAAANEFFTALLLLLESGQEAGKQNL